MEYPIIDAFINAYLVNNWTGLSTQSESVFLYTQQGTGIPTPANVRPIEPGAELIINGTPIKIYDGTLNLIDRTLILNQKGITFNGSESWSHLTYTSARAYGMLVEVPDIADGVTDICVISDYLESISNNSTWGDFSYFCTSHRDSNKYHIATGIRDIPDLDDWKNYLAENPLTCVYKLRNPETILLDDATISNLIGFTLKQELSNMLKLPLLYYFPNAVINALLSAQDGTQSDDDNAILRYYLTPLGIGGI